MEFNNALLFEELESVEELGNLKDFLIGVGAGIAAGAAVVGVYVGIVSVATPT